MYLRVLVGAAVDVIAAAANEDGRVLGHVGHVRVVFAESLGAVAAAVAVAGAVPRAQAGEFAGVQPPPVHVAEFHEAEAQRPPVIVGSRRLAIQHRRARVDLTESCCDGGGDSWQYLG